jgi:hypothetical protein
VPLSQPRLPRFEHATVEVDAGSVVAFVRDEVGEVVHRFERLAVVLAEDFALSVDGRVEQRSRARILTGASEGDGQVVRRH